jgi:hypothetical protein
MTPHLRIARPVSDLRRAAIMYCHGLNLTVLGSFVDHHGFDGVMLGMAGASYHFELTRHRAHPIIPRPTAEDLAIFYLPSRREWSNTCSRMSRAGFVAASAFNPYWETHGRTFEDHDGYRVVLENTRWTVRGSARTG